jgi:uroporphyrinogen decarboxylase
MPTRQNGAILDIVSRITVDYLSRQIEAGVDAVQLFDSWSGSLAPAQFEQLVVARTSWIVGELKKLHPDTPVIGFPKGAGGKLRAYASETGVDAIGLDETVDPSWAPGSCRRTCRSRAISTRWR